MQKYFYVQSNFSLTHFEYFHEKAPHAEGNKIPKANLKCICSFTRLLNFDTVGRLGRYETLFLCDPVAQSSVAT